MSPVPLNLHLDGDRGLFPAYLRGVYKNAVADYVGGVFHFQVNVPEDASAGIPSRGKFMARGCVHCHHIWLVVVEMVRDIGIISNVAVFAGCYFLTVDIHVAHIHDTVKVKVNLLAFPLPGGVKTFAVPSFAGRLESPPPGCLGVPWLLKLEIMRQVNAAPGTVVKRGGGGILLSSGPEFPVKVEQSSLLSRSGPGNEQELEG